ncbi:MAG: hypothetical protein J0I06_15520 [Planctomycetes bacterium]|nr:hypothetical protein [Planctomycetota bacterium]
MKVVRMVRVNVGFAACLAAAIVALSGCGDGAGRTAKVSGKVTFDGKPLDQGTITFRSPNKGAPLQSGDIKEGKYECSSPVGKVTVGIEAFQPTPAGEQTGMGKRNYIPEKYNVKSELTADVSESGPNEFNFDLRSK